MRESQARGHDVRCANPFVAGASPLSRDLDNVERLEDAGVAAIVPDDLVSPVITIQRRSAADTVRYTRSTPDRDERAKLGAFRAITVVRRDGRVVDGGGLETHYPAMTNPVSW
jgi:hypothetical protein